MQKVEADSSGPVFRTGYHAIWAAVLLQAIKDANGIINRGGGEKAGKLEKTRQEAVTNDALDWLRSDSESVGSMRWICSHLDIDYGRLRINSTSLATKEFLSKKFRTAKALEGAKTA